MMDISFVKRSALCAVLAGTIAFAAAPALAQSKPAKSASMSIVDSNKARFSMFFDDFVNKRTMATFDELVNTAFTEHQASPGYTQDYAGVKKFFTDMLAAFPDMKATIDVLVAEGDLVSAQVTWTGTHKGEFMGAPASGKTVTFKSMEIVRIKDGKAVEHWGVSDDLAIMTQLGLVHMGH